MSSVHPLSRPPRPRPATAAHTLIALHSSGSSGRQWDAYHELLPAGMRLVAPDLLGSGGAGQPAWPPDAAVSLDAEAQRLAPLLAPGGVHLLGHSYGGAVALQMALRWPDRIAALTLYEPVRFALLRGAGGAAESSWDEIVAVGREIGALTLTRRHASAARVFVDYWSGAGTWDRLPAARRDAIAARMPKVRAEFEALFADPVPAAAYAGLAMPVTVVCGTRSPLPARQVATRLSASCRGGSLRIAIGLGHMGPLEDPRPLLAALAANAGARSRAA